MISYLYLIYLLGYYVVSKSLSAINRNSSYNHNTNDVKNRYRKKNNKQQYVPYTESENIIKQTKVSWSEFLTYSNTQIRTKQYIKSNILKSLQQCTIITNKNITEYMNNTKIQQLCHDTSLWNDNFITIWKNRKVKDLCEENANSKIHCYDSIGKSRYCIFENTMMNFKKVRKRRVDGYHTRSWERGFLSADCGDMAVDDIGYQLLYKPDIEGRDDAICDYVFNETVLLYSHENIRNYGMMLSDYMNVWTMLWLSSSSHITKDISFFNMDAMKRGHKYFADQINQYFRNYNVTFRRIIKASDFEKDKSKLCFKKLILPPKPLIPYLTLEDTKCYNKTNIDNKIIIHNNNHSNNKHTDNQHRLLSISSLVQRFNLQIRQNYKLLQNIEKIPTINSIKILLILRKVHNMHINITTSLSTLINSRIIRNNNEVIKSIENMIKSEKYIFNHIQSTGESKLIPVSIISKDLSEISFEEQIQLIATTSIIIGMHGAGIVNSMHMPIGTKYCCGVIEIFPEERFKLVKGYQLLAKRLGHHYERIDLPINYTDHTGSILPTHLLSPLLSNMISNIINPISSSCFHPSVINDPYL